MTRASSVMLLIAFLAIVARAAAPVSDEEAMKGMWRATAIDRDGRPTSADELRDHPVYVEVERGSITLITQGVRGSAYRLWIDENRSLKQMDWITVGGKDDGKRLRGVYELVGDELRIGLSNDLEAARPADLKPGPGQTHWILRKQ